MNTQHTTYLYRFDGSGSPCLEMREEHRSPDAPLPSLQANSTVYMVGAFSDTTGDSPIPASPTLKLNGDLGTHDQNTLKAIAAAELHRTTSSNWPSRTLEADARVTVLARSAEQMDRFMDAYAGVLLVEPLLLEGCHPEYVTALDVEISVLHHRLYLDHRLRLPVITEQCTGCALCGPVCPEDCLSPELFLDFTKCTYCGACVDVCPVSAINLHHMENRHLEPVRLLLLDGVQLDLPDSAPKIFHESQLPALFADISARQIDETIACTSNACQYDPRLNVGCNLCTLVCRHGAVEVTREGIVVDHLHCVECGECVSACPTGAMQLLRCTDRVFLEYLSSLELREGFTVILGEEDVLKHFWWRRRDKRFDQVFFLEFPVLQAVGLLQLVSLVATGAGKIILLAREEKGGLSLAASQLNTLCKALFDREEIVTLTSETTVDEQMLGPCQPLLPAFLTPRLENRRQKLAELLYHLSRSAGRSLSLSGGRFHGFGTVHCDQDKCTLCLACLNGCHVQSLSPDENNFALLHTGSRCIQCGACTDICPEGALELRPGLHLNPGYLDTGELARTQQMTCPGCGKAFGTQKSYERIMQILAGRNMLDEDSDLFQYCERCRVIQLFERNTA
ncbi:MAG: hypothetical protein CSA34_00910 [Desulfobulbus propionicus]|nr:MAG: hypothetical protein CSA34_00910 [Desulfobulbus propionicus]